MSIFASPDMSFIFEEGDLIWISGTKEKIQEYILINVERKTCTI